MVQHLFVFFCPLSIDHDNFFKSAGRATLKWRSKCEFCKIVQLSNGKPFSRERNQPPKAPRAWNEFWPYRKRKIIGKLEYFSCAKWREKYLSRSISYGRMGGRCEEDEYIFKVWMLRGIISKTTVSGLWRVHRGNNVRDKINAAIYISHMHRRRRD